MGTLFNTFKQYVGQRIIDDLNGANNKFYVFASKHRPWDNDAAPPTAFESYACSQVQVAREMIFGKKISNTNVYYMANRYDWTSNTIYTQYTDTNANLYSSNFFVITDEYKVYKCLYNNKGVPSTVKPTLTQNTSFTTGTDGYVWKYLYTVPTQTMTQFATANLIPIVPNTTITSSALAGIDVIEVIGGGSNYKTTVSGTIQSQPSSNLVQIDTYALTDNHFYDNSAIYINSGPGAGQLATIVNYVSNSTGNWVTTNVALTSISSGFSKYTISPRVNVQGDGSGVKAYTVVNTTNYAIQSVVVINPGSGYTYANVSIVANTSYGTGANVAAYVPPYGGHGSNVPEELGANKIGFYIAFNSNESNTIPTETKYRTVGLLINPLQANSANVYSSNTFNGLLKFTTTGAVTFTLNETIIGQTSGALGYVAFSNSSITFVSGDKSFANGEIVVGQTSNVNSTINSITTRGDITPISSDILYMNNITPITRANGQNEAVKFVVQL